MPTTKTVTVYDVTELQGKAREKALRHGREMGTPYTWEVTEELHAYAIDNYGIKSEKCYWSLSHCQGDGVAFYGRLDLDIFCKKHPEFTYLLAGEFTVDIRRINSRYNHYNTMNVEIEGEDKYLDDACSSIYSILRECSKACEKYGYELLDISDEQAIDTLQANDVYFHADGTPFKGESCN